MFILVPSPKEEDIIILTVIHELRAAVGAGPDTKILLSPFILGYIICPGISEACWAVRPAVKNADPVVAVVYERVAGSECRAGNRCPVRPKVRRGVEDPGFIAAKQDTILNCLIVDHPVAIQILRRNRRRYIGPMIIAEIENPGVVELVTLFTG